MDIETRIRDFRALRECDVLSFMEMDEDGKVRILLLYDHIVHYLLKNMFFFMDTDMPST